MSGDSDSSGHSSSYSAYAGRGAALPPSVKPKRRPEWDDGRVDYSVSVFRT